MQSQIKLLVTFKKYCQDHESQRQLINKKHSFARKSSKKCFFYRATIVETSLLVRAEATYLETFWNQATICTDHGRMQIISAKLFQLNILPGHRTLVPFIWMCFLCPGCYLWTKNKTGKKPKKKQTFWECDFLEPTNFNGCPASMMPFLHDCPAKLWIEKSLKALKRRY